MKSKPIGAIFRLLWCYVFVSIFCCRNERKIVVLIFHHQQPFDFLATMCDAGGSLLHPFFFNVHWWHLHAVSRHTQHGWLYYLLLLQTSQKPKEKKVFGLQEESKMVLLSLHIIALKMLRYAVGNIAATSNLIGLSHLWAEVFLYSTKVFFSLHILALRAIVA